MGIRSAFILVTIPGAGTPNWANQGPAQLAGTSMQAHSKHQRVSKGDDQGIIACRNVAGHQTSSFHLRAARGWQAEHMICML
eukprot:344913-Pelagomonas_calceolata.AAC.9